MAGAEQIQMQQFEVAAVAAPPALLCLQLQRSSLEGVPGSEAQAANLVLQNPALLLRVLDAQFKSRASKPPKALARRLATLDLSWLHSLLSDSALQLALHGVKSSFHFYQLHWQQARLTAILARELADQTAYADLTAAETCGLLLNAGMLVLEQQYKAAWVGLYEETQSQSRLCDAERQTLGTDHIEAGVKLLQNWELEQNCIDALRYQMMPLDTVLDATTLVRICWLATRLHRQPDAEATLMAAKELFSLEPDTVEKLVADCNRCYQEELGSWHNSRYPVLKLPVDDHALVLFNQELQEGLQKLQWQMLSESALAALEGLAVDTPDNLRSVITRALQQAEVDPWFIVLSTQESSGQLRVMCSNRVPALTDELGLRVQSGRSTLADLVLTNQLGSLDNKAERLTVIDRQLLDLLGGHSLLCEPVKVASGFAVLLLANSANYPQRPLLRGFIRRKLDACLQKPVDITRTRTDGSHLELLLYRQRVREAIHEANNPLAIIKNYLQILNMKQGETGATKEIKLINGEIDRVSSILSGLRQEQVDRIDSGEIDINMLMRTMHKVFAQAFSAEQDITVTLDLCEDPALILARTDALKQILINLVKNAAEAIVGSGSIVLSTRRNVFADGKIFMQLNVADNGQGMSQDVLANLFVAGNSTKGGEHRGSGLSIVKRLVDEMEGRISCQSDGNGTGSGAGKGTVISILLPQKQ